MFPRENNSGKADAARARTHYTRPIPLSTEGTHGRGRWKSGGEWNKVDVGIVEERHRRVLEGNGFVAP
jgi:hypothetical protein